MPHTISSSKCWGVQNACFVAPTVAQLQDVEYTIAQYWAILKISNTKEPQTDTIKTMYTHFLEEPPQEHLGVFGPDFYHFSWIPWQNHSWLFTEQCAWLYLNLRNQWLSCSWQRWPPLPSQRCNPVFKFRSYFPSLSRAGEPFQMMKYP